MSEIITLEDNFILTVTDQGKAIPTAHAPSHAYGGSDALTLTLNQISDAGTMAAQNKVSVDIEGGTIDATVIGGTTKAAGSFTNLAVTGTVTLTSALPVSQGGTGSTSSSAARSALGLDSMSTQSAGSVAITGGTINNVVIGGTTPAAGTFTSLSATNFSGAFNGTVGATTPNTGAFTTVTGTTGTFSGAVSGTTGTFSGAVSGTTGTFSGAVSASSLTLTTDLPISEGGTGASTDSAARTNLKLLSGSGTLSSGTVAITVTGVTTSSVVFAAYKTNTNPMGFLKVVPTANTVTVTSHLADGTPISDSNEVFVFSIG